MYIFKSRYMFRTVKTFTWFHQWNFSGRYEKAVEDMDKALHLDPNFKSAILCREQALADFQRSEEADQPWTTKTLAYNVHN